MEMEFEHIAPDKLTDELWESMTPEKRIEWAAEECFIELTQQKIFRRKKWTDFEWTLFLQAFESGYKWHEMLSDDKTTK